MAMAREDEVRDRAHAIWEREGRPEGSAERHWAQAEEELRAEQESGGATGTTASAAAGTETWTEPGAAVPPGEGRNWWEKDATKHKSGRDQTNMAPDDLGSNEL
jgi:hypothetical protein